MILWLFQFWVDSVIPLFVAFLAVCHMQYITHTDDIHSSFTFELKQPMILQTAFSL